MILRIGLLVLSAALMGCSSGADDDRPVVRTPRMSRSTSTARDERPQIVFLGTSLTAGQGVSSAAAFPGLIQRRIDSLELGYHVVNAGLSGETSAGGLRRAEELFDDRMRILVLELGANDGLRGTNPEATRENLQAIVDLARERAPDATIILVGMQAPPNLGTTFTTRFREVFPELASQNDLVLVPFLLEGVAGIDSLNQPDGIHPTRAGHRLIAALVWKALEPVL